MGVAIRAFLKVPELMIHLGGPQARIQHQNKRRVECGGRSAYGLLCPTPLILGYSSYMKRSYADT